MKKLKLIISLFLLVFISLPIPCSPGDAGGLSDYNKGLKAFDRREMDLAIEYFTKAIKSGEIKDNETLTVLYYKLGIAWYTKKRYDFATSYFNESIKLYQGNEICYVYRGSALYRMGYYDRAISDFSKAIKLKPNYSVPYYHRAAAWEKKGEVEKQFEDLKAAAKLGNKKAKKILKKQGIKQNTATKISTQEKTLTLINAVSINDIATVKELLSENVNINAKDKLGRNALIVASSKGHVEIVRILINAGANANVKTNKGWTSLAMAIDEDRKEIAQLLRKAGAKDEDFGQLFDASADRNLKNAYTAAQTYFVDHPSGIVSLPKLHEAGFVQTKTVTVKVLQGKQLNLLITSEHQLGSKIFTIDKYGKITSQPKAN